MQGFNCHVDYEEKCLRELENSIGFHRTKELFRNLY
jgi:hypothetical protein